MHFILQSACPCASVVCLVRLEVAHPRPLCGRMVSGNKARCMKEQKTFFN